MTELTTADSFIVRIYRIDTEDQRKLTGLVEALDGSGERTPFTDIDELAAVLGRSGTGKRGGGKGEMKPKKGSVKEAQSRTCEMRRIENRGVSLISRKT